ncbi:MAG TPA: hypothetical protein VLW85_10300, partial [Myxococcales bacterium]|nr:hypothetical protein [Myxococcales bacterium]
PDIDVSTVPAHFRNLPEIMVTRRYFRSGESEYFLNKTPCRLKDITELFLGTGVGSKAYAIIEQGRVEQLINAKPEDRRLFIEEAAGTTLYRSRRLAAERKMERTRENLLRVNDVLREIDRQIQYLHRMAKKAEQYRALQDEVRRLDLALSGAQWRRLTAAVAALEAELVEVHEQERLTLEELSQLEVQRSDRLGAVTAAEDELARQREAAAVLEAECQSLQQRMALLRQEVGERERRLGRLQSEFALLAQQRVAVQEAMQQHEGERLACAQHLLTDEAELERRTLDLTATRAAAAAATAEVEATKSAVIGSVAQESEYRNALATQARRRAEAQRRLERLAGEQAEASEHLAAAESAAAARRADIAALREQLRTAEGEKEQRAERVRALAEERRGWERETNAARDLLVQLRSRLDSLQDIQRNYEGYQRGVRSILLDDPPRDGVLGVVGDVIGVPQEYERAVAAALGDRLQYVIVRGEDDGVGAVTTLRDRDSGRGSFIPLSPRRVQLNGKGASSLNGNTRRLLDVVEVDEPYRNVAETLLSEVVVVPDLGTGLALWRQNGVHVTMVTRDGDVIDATGVVSGGSERPLEEDFVSRRRLVGELTTELADAETRLARAQAEMERLRVALEEQETALQNLDRDTHRLTLELVAAEKDLERLEAERPRWLDRLEVARFESSRATAEENDCVVETQRLEGALAATALAREGLEQTLRDRQAAVDAATARVDEIGSELTAIKVRVAEQRQRQEAALATLARLQSQAHEQTAREVALGNELEATEQERVNLQAALAEADAQRSAHEMQRRAIDEQLEVARAALEAAQTALAAHDQSARAAREQLDALRSRGGQREIALAEQRVRAEHLVQNMRERYGTELADHAPSDAAEEEEPALHRLEMLREKLGRIGEV